MFELRARIRDADTGSLLDRRTTRGDDASSGGGGIRLLAAGCLVAVLSSLIASVVAHGLLPSRVRIHWSLGMGPYYGPEFAPTAAVLAGFSLLVTATALGAYLLGRRLRRHEAFVPVRPYYVIAVVGTLGVLLGTQIVLVVLNV